MALHPDVIVLPVVVHVFLGQGETVPRDVSREMIRYRFDPGHALVTEAVLVNDSQNGLEAYTTVAEHERFAVLPDTVWTQCNIQFALVDVEYVQQDDGLESLMFADDEGTCDGSGLDCNTLGQFGTYRETVQRSDAINVYLGGDFASDCGSNLMGITCGPSSACTGDVTPQDFIAIERNALRARPDVFAHELGHFLGLGHQDFTCTDEPSSAWSTQGNIMRSAGAATGEGGAVTITAARLTPAQCTVARTIAQQLVDAFGS